MDIFQVLFYQPTFNLLVIFTNWFGSIGIGIIIIAFIAKLITLPLTNAQIKNASKSKDLQVKFKKLKEKYENNQEKLAKEMAKLQAEVLPGQLGGCLSVIVFIILFIQIRGVILDLVNKGYHSFNEVSYSSVLEKKEDFVKYTLDSDLPLGENRIELNLTASNGNNINKVYEFLIVEDKEKGILEYKSELIKLSDEDKNSVLKEKESQLHDERISDISVYNKELDNSLVNIPLESFLIFTTSSSSVNIIENTKPDLSFYIRPPSGELIDYSKTELLINDTNVTDNIIFQQGDKIELDFLGANLSKVATDFGVTNLDQSAPYIVLSVFSGITQYFVSKLYGGSKLLNDDKNQVKDNRKKDDLKKKKKNNEEPDFTEMMSQSTKQMSLFFPIFTVAISLGYFGGASFIPMGVTLFWTAQNTFVIIQQVYNQRDTLKLKINEKFKNIQLSLNKAEKLNK